MNILRKLWCLLVGHAPICVVYEQNNKSVLECERCGKFLEDFVINLRK